MGGNCKDCGIHDEWHQNNALEHKEIKQNVAKNCLDIRNIKEKFCDEDEKQRISGHIQNLYTRTDVMIKDQNEKLDKKVDKTDYRDFTSRVWYVALAIFTAVLISSGLSGFSAYTSYKIEQTGYSQGSIITKENFETEMEKALKNIFEKEARAKKEQAVYQQPYEHKDKTIISRR